MRGFSLGGHISSKDIVQGLVNRSVQTMAAKFKIVAPGDPDHSWLYLKPAEARRRTPAASLRLRHSASPA